MVNISFFVQKNETMRENKLKKKRFLIPTGKRFSEISLSLIISVFGKNVKYFSRMKSNYLLYKYAKYQVHTLHIKLQ